MWPSPTASPAPQRVSRGAWPATPNCCCWRSPTSAGCSTRPADRSSSKTSPGQLAEQAWQHFRDIERRGGFVEALERFRHLVDRGGEPSVAPRHRTPAHQSSPVSTSTPILAEPPLSRSAWGRRCGATRPGSRRCATARTAISKRTGSRPQVLLLPLGTAAEHNIRATFAVQPVGVRRHRGGEPRNRRCRWCPASGFGRRQPPPSRVCGTDARYGTDASDVVRRRQTGRCLTDLPRRARKGGRRSRFEARRLPDRQDRRGRRPFFPP